MKGLFEEEVKQEALFQDKKKKDVKKVFKNIVVTLLIIIILLGIAYGIFYYLTEMRNRDVKADIIGIAKNIDFNKYTDIEGLSEYFDNINANSYEFNVGLEANNHELNNAIKDLTNNEEINIKEFKLDFDGKVDKKNNKLQTKINLKHKDKDLIDFQIQDTNEQILLYGDKFFKEHIGIDKDKLKSFMINEYALDNSIAETIDEFTGVALDRNYIKEMNSILNCVVKALPETLEILTNDNFEIQKNMKVNYRNNSLNAETYTIKLNYQQYTNVLARLKTLSKIEANNVSIELQSLIGKTDKMIDWIINYFQQIISLKSNQDLNINIYKVKSDIVKIDFIKLNNSETNNKNIENIENIENTENIEEVDSNENIENKEDKLAFEIELISEKNTNEILISNNELKLKITITKDNSKVYTKLDIDGKVPIPAALDLEENPVQEIKEDETEDLSGQEEANVSILGEQNVFSAEAIIMDPIVEEVDSNLGEEGSNIEADSDLEVETNLDQPVSSEDSNLDQIEDATILPLNTDETPDILFVEDDDLTEIDESIYTKKIDLKANLSFDRPLNNSSMMSFNLVFNSNEIELLIKADIGIKDNVVIENPMQVIVLTSMNPEQLKKNMKVINETIYSVFIHKLKKENIIK